MKVSEIIIKNKGKYTKVFVISNDKITNEAIFTRIDDKNLDEKLSDINAKDYFILEKEGFEEVFGYLDQLELIDDDKILIIGI